jgi:hypothetical protein
MKFDVVRARRTTADCQKPGEIELADADLQSVSGGLGLPDLGGLLNSLGSLGSLGLTSQLPGTGALTLPIGGTNAAPDTSTTPDQSANSGSDQGAASSTASSGSGQ